MHRQNSLCGNDSSSLLRARRSVRRVLVPALGLLGKLWVCRFPRNPSSAALADNGQVLSDESLSFVLDASAIQRARISLDRCCVDDGCEVHDSLFGSGVWMRRLITVIRDKRLFNDATVITRPKVVNTVDRKTSSFFWRIYNTISIHHENVAARHCRWCDWYDLSHCRTRMGACSNWRCFLCVFAH